MFSGVFREHKMGTLFRYDLYRKYNSSRVNIFFCTSNIDTLSEI